MERWAYECVRYLAPSHAEWSCLLSDLLWLFVQFPSESVWMSFLKSFLLVREYMGSIQESSAYCYYTWKEEGHERVDFWSGISSLYGHQE